MKKVAYSAGSARLALVTVNFRCRALVYELLTSMSRVPGVSRAVVVNHSPGDGLEEGLPRLPFPVTVINQSNRGYAAGLNRGLREVAGIDATAMLCNPDVIVLTPEAVEEALAFMARAPRVACLIPTLVGAEGQCHAAGRRFYTIKTLIASRLPWCRRQPPACLRDHLYLDQDTSRPFDVDWGSGAAMLFKTWLYPNPLRFDERFFLYFEDVDLCTEVWRNGYSVVRYPGLVCRHQAMRKSHRSPLFLVFHVSSLVKYVRKHGGLPQRSSEPVAVPVL